MSKLFDSDINEITLSVIPQGMFSYLHKHYINFMTFSILLTAH